MFSYDRLGETEPEGIAHVHCSEDRQRQQCYTLNRPEFVPVHILQRETERERKSLALSPSGLSYQKENVRRILARQKFAPWRSQGLDRLNHGYFAKRRFGARVDLCVWGM